MELANQKQIAVKRAAAIAVLFVGAFAARIFWISQTRAMYGGEGFYTWLGTAPQLSPLYVGVADFVARAFEIAGVTRGPALEYGSIAVYALAGGLLVAPIYGLARRLAGEGIAAGVSLAAVFYPVSLTVLPGAGAMTEPLYLLLVASSWYCLLRSMDERNLWLAAAGGVLVGLAYLSLTVALPLMLLALGLLLFATWQLRRDDLVLSRAATDTFVALLAFGAVLAACATLLGGMRL